MKEKKTKEEWLEQAIDDLDEVSYHFACFVDHFKRYVSYDEGFKEFLKNKNEFDKFKNSLK